VATDKVTVLRPDVDPGDEAQIDYGYLGRWLDPATGRMRRVWAFVMVLAFSRHVFVRPTLSMNQAQWTAAHVEAFAYFGGAVRRVVPDNLKTGVIKPDIYDPRLNRSYEELGAYYGVLIDPARAVKPKDKVWATDCTSCWFGWEDVVHGLGSYRCLRGRTYPAARRRAA